MDKNGVQPKQNLQIDINLNEFIYFGISEAIAWFIHERLRLCKERKRGYLVQLRLENLQSILLRIPITSGGTNHVEQTKTFVH